MGKPSEKIRHLMDACRSLENDLEQDEFRDLAEALEADPETQREFERVLRWDSAIAAAMVDVDVPEGLQTRLLAQLERADEPSAPEAAHADAVEVAMPEAAASAPEPQVASPSRNQPPSTSQLWTRRGVAGALVAIAAALVIIAFGLPGQTPLTQEALQEMALSWPSQLGSEWEVVTQETINDQPIPFQDLICLPLRAQQVELDLGVSSFCYELKVPAGTGIAHLFVLPADQATVRNSTPTRPFTTRGKCVGVWKSGEAVYVLVFEGSDRDYRRLLAHQQGVA